jgi:hypothetical protein
MDGKHRYNEWSKIQKPSAFVLPPVMFIAGWVLAKAFVVPRISVHPLDAWRIPMIAGCAFAVIALAINLEKAAPRNKRELKLIAVCAVLYGVMVASLFAVSILDCILFPSALNLLAVGVVLYVLQRSWRLGRDFEGGLEFQAMERGEDLASGRVRLFEVLVVHGQVDRNVSVGRYPHPHTKLPACNPKSGSVVVQRFNAGE